MGEEIFMKARLNYFFSLDIYQLKIIVTTMIIKVILETADDIPYLSIYIFNIKIYKKRYQISKENTSIIKVLQIDNTKVGRTEVSYGFGNPATTGLIYGALSVLPNINQVPNFLPQYDYIIVDGSTHIYLWSTMMNYVKYCRKVRV